MEYIDNEILALTQKKDLLENTIAELKKDSDEMAYEAEKQSKLELLSKSNTLKQAATEKQVEFDVLLVHACLYFIHCILMFFSRFLLLYKVIFLR